MKGADSRWFCEKIIIREGRDVSAPTLYFYCGEWLDSNDDDRKTKLLLPQEPPQTPEPDVTSVRTPSRDFMTPRDPTPLCDMPDLQPQTPESEPEQAPVPVSSELLLDVFCYIQHNFTNFFPVTGRPSVSFPILHA